MRRRRIADDVYRFILGLPDDEFAGLNVKQLAKRLGISRCHLSRTFHSEKKMTLSDFISRQRLVRAERLLSQAQPITVKELALRLGFSDYQYFITCFKEHWGESPGRYRKIVRGFGDEEMPADSGEMS